MSLVLSTLRCPPGVSPQRREVVRGALSIGRGAECDWVLPDPDRILSKRHCLLDWQNDSWLLTDTSSNGTLLDGAPLDPGVPRRVRSGDRLVLGAYEIEVRLDESARTLSGGPPTVFARPRVEDRPAADRSTADPFEPDEALPDVGLPADFDPLDAGDKVPENPFAAADHTPDLAQHFRPPRPQSELLPEDWDRRTAMRPPADPLSETRTATPPPAAVQASPSVDTGADAGAGFRAFAAGAGIEGAPRLDASETLVALGAAFRATVSGLRRAMIARAAIKGEFRIEQTVIRSAGNNPLKFAADDDDALAALLGIGRQGGMTPERAIAEAMRDMRRHELAVMSAMGQAVRDLLASLAPDKVLRDLPAGAGDAFPGRRKQRAWDSYDALHARVTQALADDFDSVFGRSFMRAYERALADVTAAESDERPADQTSRRRPT